MVDLRVTTWYIDFMSTIQLVLMYSALSINVELPPGLLSAVCYVESRHKHKAVNLNDGGEDSLGVCQIKLNTARLVGFKGTAKQLMQPTTNALYAAKYLKKQLIRYNNDPRKAVAAYNAGKVRYNKDGLIMNRLYVAKVFKAWSENR